MASFQTKIRWERPRNSENKNNKKIVPMSSYSTRDREFQKNSIKIQKIQKYHNGFISSQNWLEKVGDRVTIKIIGPFGTYPARYRKFQNHSKKIQKIWKYHNHFI